MSQTCSIYFIDIFVKKKGVREGDKVEK